ncbi:hypothetical protein FACS1894205_1250 [Alphaproteobacteria bacterium]|nr:hypothetical protein FACS1894205_1250 [Alphaproteobacteria bacterium]
MKYDDFLSTAFSLCGQGRVHVLPWLPDEPPHEFLHRFGDAAGLSFLMQAPSDFSPYRAPGYFFDFVRESFGWRKPYTEESATPWTAQIGRFKQRNPQLKSVPVLRPGFHKELMQFFEDSNANAARMLGMERLFPSQTESEDVSERLNQDNALRVAESLEPAFAGELLREFQENHNYLSFNGRLCLQALSRTCGARSVVVQYPQPKVSVLTLAYNHAAFIAENIESVIAQKTSFPIQHVIADDASDDGTQDIILKYAAKYPHIVPVLQKKRTYGSGNVQTLFEMARAEYVALCDGDDYFTDSDKLQIQADFLDANPDCALCAHSTRVIYEGRPDLKESVYPQLPDSEPLFFGSFKNLALANFISTSSVMYRWRFRDGLPDWFRPDLMPGDWYWHLLHAEVGGIGIINKVMSVYRKHPGGVYSSAIKDPLKHRNDTALYYMGVFNVILDHFSGKFDDELLLSSAVQILRECLLYYKQGREGAVFQTIIEKYPVLSQKIVNLMAKQGAG